MFTDLNISGHTLSWGQRTYIMGILNLTPDSFSGDGIFQQGGQTEGSKNQARGAVQEAALSSALSLARDFIQAGADILDVGGESTRPGAQTVSAGEELDRVLPVIRALASQTECLISIDTYKAEVAEAAIQAGAHIVNDVWGFKVDSELAGVAASHEIPAILMHNRSSWAHAEIKEQLGGRYVGVPYEDLMEDIQRELLESVGIALSAGVPREHILLDPGIGFGKTVEQNLELIDRLDEIRALGYPLLVGPSRKSFIGYTLDLPPDQRLEGTAAAVAISIVRGADILRVHDVEFMARVARMTDAIIRRDH
jgi:dihydropteroate synthase